VAGGPPLQPADPLGVLPLILWALILAILINYLAFGLCADNQREGGIIALVVLLNPWRCEAGEPPSIPMLRGCSALASCMTTGRLPPAISALSAVERLKVAPSDAAYAANCFVAESLWVFLAPGAVCLVVTRVCCRLPWLAGRGGGRVAACCRFPKARARQTGVHTGLRTDSVSGTGEKTPGRRCKSPDSRMVSHIAVHRRHENSTGYGSGTPRALS